MATESTAQLLEKIRSNLLELAGSNPATPSASSFPSLDEVVVNSGAGPFRCQKCKASLLRGPNSQICAACGTEREGVASSFQISFVSTLAYQMLMDSFQSQDSEVATGKGTQHAEAASMPTQQTETVDGSIACDILNLVLKWPEVEAKFEEASLLQITNANATPGMEFDLEDFFVQSKSHNVAGLPKEISTSTHHREEDVKWSAPAGSMPQVSLSEINIDLFGAQKGSQTHIHAASDPFGDFKSSNLSLENSESKNQEVFMPIDQIEDVKCNAPTAILPQVNFSESNRDLFNAQPGWQTQMHIKDGDIFGDLKSANATDYKLESNNQVSSSTHHREDYHTPADPMPAVNYLSGSRTGRQQAHARDDDPFGDFRSANTISDNSALKDEEVVTSTHHVGDLRWHPLVGSMPQESLNVEEYHPFADPMPQVNFSENHMDLLSSQRGRQQTNTGDDDPFGEFTSANSIPDNYGSKDEKIATSTHHIGEMKWHPLVDSMPQISLNESSIDLFSLHPGTQQTETNIRDDDPFGDFESADSKLGDGGSKNPDVSAASFNDYHFNLMEETMLLDRNRLCHSTFHGQDLFPDPGNSMEHVTPKEGSWMQADPWAAMTTEEIFLGSSNNLKESADLQPDWPEKNILADTHDPFSSSIWEQHGISYYNELATEKSRHYTTHENRGVEHDVHLTTDLSSQALDIDKETSSINSILTEVNRFNRVESSEVNHQEKSKSASLDMEEILVAMPKGSSNDDCGHVIKSLLSEMHDLSFMLADHLVIPYRDGKHSKCL